MFSPVVLDEIEKRYWRDVWHAANDDAFEELGIELRTFGPVQASIVAMEPDEPMLNLVLGAGIPGAVEAGHLAGAIEWVQSHEVDYRVPVTPGPAAGRAEKWLTDSRHERGGSWSKFVRDASSPSIAEPIGIEAICRGPAEDESFGDPFAEILGIPDWAATLFLDLPGMEGWHCYVAVEGDDALAHIAMLVHAGVAEVVLGSNPGVERHGEGQLALLRRCIGDATDAGCEAIFAETLEFDPEPLSDSRESLQQAGFERAFVRHDWRPPRELVAEASSQHLFWRNWPE